MQTAVTYEDNKIKMVCNDVIYILTYDQAMRLTVQLENALTQFDSKRHNFTLGPK